MASVAPTMLRAWPVPGEESLGSELSAALDRTDHIVVETESFRGVLVIDDGQAPGGINAYAPLIAALREARVNVYAENEAACGIPARCEWCAGDRTAVRRRLDPETGLPLVALDELVVACCEAGGATCEGPIGLEQINDSTLVRTVRLMFEQRSIPEGVRRPGLPTDPEAF